MKKIILALEKQLENLRELINQREDFVLDRSEKWQESEKCEEHEDKTSDLDMQADELDNLIDELKELS